MKQTIRIKFTLMVCLLLAFGFSFSVASAGQDLSTFFKGTEGAFVLFDMNNNRYLRYNEARCRQRFSPFSTFKIPHSLIGLETGAVPDENYVMAWDKQKYPPQDFWNSEPFIHWKQDHTMRSAIKYSVVWFYRELAKRIGARRMHDSVSAFRYGNQDIGGGLSDPNRYGAFWLDNTLAISADEQIEFLKKFYTGRLPVSKRSLDIVKNIVVLEETPAYKLSGKTGGGTADDGKALGWFVGYLQTKGNVYFFATNIEGSNFAEIRDKRINLTKQILKKLGYLPMEK